MSTKKNLVLKQFNSERIKRRNGTQGTFYKMMNCFVSESANNFKKIPAYRTLLAYNVYHIILFFYTAMITNYSITAAVVISLFHKRAQRIIYLLLYI